MKMTVVKIIQTAVFLTFFGKSLAEINFPNFISSSFSSTFTLLGSS